jgi:hypothetical protein
MDNRNRALSARRTVVSALAVIAVAGFAPAALAAGKAAAPSLEGVWKVTKVVNTGENGGTVDNPQPGLMIFSRGYYSFVAVPGSKARMAAPAAKDLRNPTDAEKLAQYAEWNTFIGQSGTYDVKGSTLLRTPMVAKNVVVMTTPEGRAEQAFKLTGKTLVLVTKSSPGEPPREQQMTLTRLR